MASDLSKSPEQSRRPWRRFFILLAAIVAVGYLNYPVWRAWHEENTPPPRMSADTFVGSSENLPHTIFLPTLESPIPEGKTAIWCSTLALAWQHLENNVFQKPVVVIGAEEVSRDLSRAATGEIAAEDYYVKAGWVEDGIVEEIQRDFKAMFPKARQPKIESSPKKLAIAFAYLQTAIKFPHPFNEAAKPMPFKDSSGKITPVQVFGLPEELQGKKSEKREQVQVLFQNKEEFALDLSRATKPYQIVLARIQRKPTLKATMDDLNGRISSGSRRDVNDGAIMLVPNMDWKIDHRFTELEGKSFQGMEAWFGRAYQWIDFKMDRKGIILSSGAGLDVVYNGHDPGQPEYLLFDRPYLIVLRKRGTIDPFFAMWVDNAELLQPSARE